MTSDNAVVSALSGIETNAGGESNGPFRRNIHDPDDLTHVSMSSVQKGARVKLEYFARLRGS